MKIVLSNGKYLSLSNRYEWWLYDRFNHLIIRSYSLYDIHIELQKECIIGRIKDHYVLLRVFQPYKKSKLKVYNIYRYDDKKERMISFTSNHVQEFISKIKALSHA